MDKKQVEALTRPFPDKLIKQRRGSHGKMLDYIEGGEVIRRLNDVLEGRWSFEVLEHWISETTTPPELVVLGRFKEVQTAFPPVVKEAFGGKELRGIGVADGYKAAATDALKKCASMLGVALHLYTEGEPHFDEPTAHAKGKDPRPKREATPESASKEQLLALHALRIDPRLPDSWRMRIATRLADGNVPLNQANQMSRTCIGQIQAATGIDYAPWEGLEESQRGQQLAAVAKHNLQNKAGEGPEGGADDNL